MFGTESQQEFTEGCQGLRTSSLYRPSLSIDTSSQLWKAKQMAQDGEVPEHDVVHPFNSFITESNRARDGCYWFNGFSLHGTLHRFLWSFVFLCNDASTPTLLEDMKS